MAEVTIRNMQPSDWEDVREIYLLGIKTNNATFQTTAPTYEEWDNGHLPGCRFICEISGEVAGWAALSPTSSREVYKGVCEVSIYVHPNFQGQGAGTSLLSILCAQSEDEGIWTLQSAIIKENDTSIALHERCGFRLVGYREKIAKDSLGNWRDTVFMERRSKTIL